METPKYGYTEEHLKDENPCLPFFFSVPGRSSVVLFAVDIVVHLPLVVLGLDNKHGRLYEWDQVLGKKHASPLVAYRRGM